MKNEFVGEVPKAGVGLLFARVGDDAEKACGHADDVSVENRPGLVEGDAANRAGGVAANARQGENIVEVSGEISAVFRDNNLGGALQIADTGVVAETFPEFVEFGGRRAGGGLNRRQLAHPTFVKRDHGFDLGLLEHDFGNPDGVGIVGAAPGEVAGVGGEPDEQPRDQLFQN